MNSSMWQMFSTNTPQKTSKAQRLSMKLPTPFEIMMWKEEKEKKKHKLRAYRKCAPATSA